MFCFARQFGTSPENAVGAALCGRPSPVAGRSPIHPVGEGLAPPAMSREWPWLAVGAGPRPARPLRTMTLIGRAASQGFALRGDLLCPRRQRRQNAAGGGLRWASPPIVAPPPDPRNLRGPNSGGCWGAVRRGRDNDCPRIRAAAAVPPKSRRLDWLDQTGAPDRSGSNLCWRKLAGGSGDPPVLRLCCFCLRCCRGGPMWPPADFPPGNVSSPSRRGGACPSRRFSEFFRSTLGFRPLRRRAESSRPTDVIVHGRRAATEGRPYGISGASQQNRTTGGHLAAQLLYFFPDFPKKRTGPLL